MYEGWRIERWNTPVSDIRSLSMVSMVDDAELSLTLAGTERTERWRFSFATYPAYKNILEEYRLELWRTLDETQQRCGNTFTVANSTWLAQLREREPLLDVHFPHLYHYVVATNDDVIEILSPKPPRICPAG